MKPAVQLAMVTGLTEIFLDDLRHEVLTDSQFRGQPGHDAEPPKIDYRRLAAELRPMVEEVVKANMPAPVPGPRGEKGQRGDRGETGTTGKRGARGVAGTPGQPGIRGLTGARGPEGRAGPVGPTGSPGDRGAQGETGSTGEKGEAGPRGAGGTIGKTGAPGTAGPIGPRGYGYRGERGERGTIGKTGETGQRGARGRAAPPADEPEIVRRLRNILENEIKSGDILADLDARLRQLERRSRQGRKKLILAPRSRRFCGVF